MKKKKSKIVLTSIVVLIIALFVGCTSNKKEDVKTLQGKWLLTNDTDCDFLDDDVLRINDDKTLEGVSDYNEFSLSDEEGVNHMIFKGYGDSKRFEYKFNKTNQLEVLEENVSDSLTCIFEKAD